MIISGAYPGGYTLAAKGNLSIASSGVIGGAGLKAGASATIVNAGKVAAGPGANSYTYGGAGLNGVTLTTADTITNNGSIRGGAGGQGLYEFYGYSGGPTGGVGGVGGAGVWASHANIANTAKIIGGAGGYGYEGGGAGGLGVRIDSATLNNSGTIFGGLGGNVAGYDYGGTGGGGVSISSGKLVNSGEISGGAGGSAVAQSHGQVGGDGGVGVRLAGATLANSGVIRGGTGGYGYHLAGYGGDGVDLATTSGVVVNAGEILGGLEGGDPSGYLASYKGDAIAASHGALIANRAGAEIAGYRAVADAGYGEVTVVNSGTLAGYNYAVSFRKSTDKLIEEAGGVIHGDVLGGHGALELGAAGGAGTIAGIGVTMLDFDTITVDAGAGWLFQGTNKLAGGETLRSASAITENGVLSNDGVIVAAAAIDLATGGQLANLASGTIALTGAAGVSPASGATGTSLFNSGVLEKTSGADSVVGVAVRNTGVIAALAGILDFTGAVSGSGTVRISAGAADFGSTFAERVTFVAGATGMLELAKSESYSGSISGFSTKTSLDLGDIAFGGSTKATFSGTSASGVLTVTDGTHVAKIKLIGDYSGATFTVASDGHGGTLVTDPIKAPAARAFAAAMAGLGPSGPDAPLSTSDPAARSMARLAIAHAG